MTVGGRIIIAAEIPAFRRARVYIYLEDASRADSESVVISETVIEGVDHDDEEQNEITFRLDISDTERIDPKNFYSVRVWINKNGDGKADERDLFSDRAYRVLTGGFGDSVEIKIGF